VVLTQGLTDLLHDLSLAVRGVKTFDARGSFSSDAFQHEVMRAQKDLTRIIREEVFLGALSLVVIQVTLIPLVVARERWLRILVGKAERQHSMHLN
jgi:hypothetical protein